MRFSSILVYSQPALPPSLFPFRPSVSSAGSESITHPELFYFPLSPPSLLETEAGGRGVAEQERQGGGGEDRRGGDVSAHIRLSSYTVASFLNIIISSSAHIAIPSAPPSLRSSAPPRPPLAPRCRRNRKRRRWRRSPSCPTPRSSSCRRQTREFELELLFPT